ncbi:MAG: S8 family serine peptidase [Bryobacteraceae bacterium]
MTVRVGIVDSGVHAEHPHVGDVKGGVLISSDGDPADYIDRIGHGTAVAGAIRERAPGAELYAVRIFERRLSASIEILMRGLEWCIENGMHIVNLSVGTENERHRPMLEDYMRRARTRETFVIGAVRMLPGSLECAIGVESDPECPRDVCRFKDGVFFASPYPRPIPGVPRERNLHGVSFSIANCTGLLAHAMESAPAGDAYREFLRAASSPIASSSNPFNR